MEWFRKIIKMQVGGSQSSKCYTWFVAEFVVEPRPLLFIQLMVVTWRETCPPSVELSFGNVGWRLIILEKS